MSGIRKDVQRLEKEKAKAQLSSDLKKEAEICNELGELYVQNGQFEEALKEHQQELQLSESTNDVVGAAVAHRRIGECHLELGSFQRAVKHHHKHLNLAKSADSYLEQQRALATIGRTHLCQADVLEGDEQMEALGKSKSAFLGSMRVCENHLQGVVSTREYHEMRARIFLNLGLVFDYQKDFNNSIKFIQQASHISEKNHLNEDLLRCHHSLADIYRNAGEFAKSLTLLGKALQITKSMKNKEKETAILTAQGHIHFQLGDFLAAKKAFKRAYRLGSETDAERLKVTTALQRAIKGCKLEKMIEQAVRDSNQKERMALEEQFGDLCCKMSSYNEAIQHYKRQLDCALSLEVPPLQLIPIYVSLAATYADNKQYSSAVEMYSKELKLRSGNPKEECLTWLNVADAQERAGQEYEVLHQSYKRAVECAETAEITKLQFRALKSLMLVQEHFKEETHLWLSKKKLSRLKEEQNLPSDYEPSSDEEEEGEESNNSLETEDLTLDLSDSGNSEGEQEDFDRPTSSNRAQIAKFSKTNEKGETLLHRACIDGNFRQVKSLLEKGHPVNPRDYCGWLPLHEASNHDHYAIVEILIEHGAAINDRGGAQCGGITPLHDAISCGNLEVAELLVQKGASVIAKDDNGLSALDTLEKWKEMNMGGLDDDVVRQSQNLAEQLLNAAEASPAVVSSTPEVPGNSLLNSDLYDNEEDSQSQSQTGTLSQYQIGPLSQSNKPYGNVSAGIHRKPEDGLRTVSKHPNRRSLSIRSQRDEASSSDEEGELEKEEDIIVSGISQSQSSELPTMTSFKRNHSCSILGSQKQTSPKPLSVSPMVSSESGEIPVRNTSTAKGTPHEDARVVYRTAMDSVGSATSRLTVKKHPGTSVKTSHKTDDKVPLISENDYVAEDWLIEDLAPSKRRRVDGRDVFREAELNSVGRHEETSRLSRKKRKKQTQLKLTGILHQRPRNTSERGDSSNDERETEPMVPSSSPMVSQSIDNHHQVAVVSSSPPATASAMRVKVRVVDKVFLISVPLSSPKTIKWLSEETGNRYYSFSGLRPLITLTTADKALFSPDDVVSEILNNNEEVLANVESWHMPPLQERYRTLCQKNSQSVHGKIESRLEMQDQHHLDLSSLTLTEGHLKPLFSALQCQHSLRKLLLARNRINDKVMASLAESLPSLPNLCLIDLSCNEVTHEGLRRVSEVLSKETTEGVAMDGSSVSKPLQYLEELVLDYNSLTDNCALYIASILKHCPLLNRLSLTSTYITKRFFQFNSTALLEAFQGAGHLQSLNVSHNALGSSGVELLLKCLNPESINSLNLGSTIQRTGDSSIAKHLASFYSKGNCCLHNLNLEDCKLKENDMKTLSKCIPGSLSVSWSHLGLSANPLITHRGIHLLLAGLQEAGCGLKSLDLSMCGLESPLEGDMFDLLAGFMSPEHPSGEALAKVVLSGNKLSKVDLEVLINVWEATHDESAGHCIDKVRCILYA